MVLSVMSLTRNGLRDWLIQRVSAVVMVAYLVCVGYHLKRGGLEYTYWHTVFSGMFFKVATIVTLLQLMLHSWVGVWTISTDYLKCAGVRLGFQMCVAIALLGYLVWGIAIVWGVRL